MTRKLAVLLFALTLAACADSGADGNAVAPVALVTLGMVEHGTLAQQITLYGVAEPGPGGKATLAAPAEATVMSIAAPVGMRVTRGTVIVRLAASPTTRVDLVKATSDARAATAALKRAERLKADGLGSNAEVETARAAATGASATRAAIATRTGGLIVRAPGTGIVTALSAAPGDLVQAGAALATIERDTALRARFGIDPASARTLRHGTPLRIAPSGGAAPLDTPIAAIDPNADPQTRLASVFARIPAQSGIGMGQTLTATVAVPSRGATLTIPYAALLDDGGQAYVYAVAGGIAHRRDITIGAASGDRVAVSGGLHAGDRVVVAGGTAVEDGMKVRTK